MIKNSLANQTIIKMRGIALLLLSLTLPLIGAGEMSEHEKERYAPVVRYKKLRPSAAQRKIVGRGGTLENLQIVPKKNKSGRGEEVLNPRSWELFSKNEAVIIGWLRVLPTNLLLTLTDEYKNRISNTLSESIKSADLINKMRVMLRGNCSGGLARCKEKITEKIGDGQPWWDQWTKEEKYFISLMKAIPNKMVEEFLEGLTTDERNSKKKVKR